MVENLTAIRDHKVTLIASQWEKIQSRMRKEFGDVIYRSWLKPLSLLSRDGGSVRLSVSTRFIRDWVTSHYLEKLRQLWIAEDASVKDVTIVLEESPHRNIDQSAQLNAEDSVGQSYSPGNLQVVQGSAHKTSAPSFLSTQQNREELGVRLDPRFTFDHFIVGKSNELAYSAARRVAESATVSYNPLFLYGGVGLGKTHLMHAIAWHIRQISPERRVLYMSAEKFMYQFIKALRHKDTFSFKEEFRSVDVLMIDDVQFICGKDSTQEEFFHTFNELVDKNHQVVVSADKSPANLEGLEERMRSRLGWGLVADIHPTTYELRLSIVQAKSELLKSNVPLNVLEFLAKKITSNVRELEGALNRVIAHAALVNTPITIEGTQELLRDLLKQTEKQLTIEDIQKKVSEHYHVKIIQMHSPSRARNIARPRQVAMYLAKQLTVCSLPEIGKKFGGRDHTTVLHAVKKVEELCGQDKSFAEDVEILRRSL